MGSNGRHTLPSVECEVKVYHPLKPHLDYPFIGTTGNRIGLCWDVIKDVPPPFSATRDSSSSQGIRDDVGKAEGGIASQTQT